jgi:membrane peptidoglycan carboxypeptidase
MCAGSDCFISRLPSLIFERSIVSFTSRRTKTKVRKLQKGQEAIIALMLDKERILELYISVIEWGDGVFGAQAAAQHY